MSANRSVVYACLFLILLGIVLSAISFSTSDFDREGDIQGEHFFSFWGKHDESIVKSESVLLDPQSIFGYYEALLYVSHSTDNPPPTTMTGTLRMYEEKTNSLISTTTFEFYYKEQPLRLPVEAPNSEYYVFEVDFSSQNWSDWGIHVNIYREMRAPLMIGLASLGTGSVMLSIILLMSKRQKPLNSED
jgi:hypothetical protein